MNEIIKDKITQIKEYVTHLEEMKPSSLEEYIEDVKTKAACERYVEKIMEATVDLAFLIIKDKKFKSPEDDVQAFSILEDNKIISLELAKRLQAAKGMRNFLAHEYGEVDDEIVFHAVSELLNPDVTEFINNIEQHEKR
jgi:uncharacterized protein YutE (UPF0331/DUF86 family)